MPRSCLYVRTGNYYAYVNGKPIYNYFRDYDPQTGRYVESDPLGLTAGMSTYGYALQAPTTLFDATGLKSMSYDEMQDIVSRFNMSGLPDALILCMAWNESDFDPLRGANNFGRGLLGLSSIATDQVNLGNGNSAYSFDNWPDPSFNVEVASQFLKYVYNRREHQNVARAIRKYGGRPTYPVGRIMRCEKCLKDQDARSN